MKILWLCNIPLPDIAIDMSYPIINGGGWLVGLSNDLKKCPDIELNICFPLSNEKEIIKGRLDNINYYGFPKKLNQPHKYDISVEEHLKYILNEVTPDIVHIFGTEYPHSLSMTKVFNKPDRTIINIQGLCSIYTKHYTSGLAYNIISQYTFRDFIKQDNIRQQQKKFEKRGKMEITAIKNVNHIIGRTTWDKACVSQINPNAKYHFCNETLRDEFYKYIWDINNCEKYSIFISQGGYPIKGLHFMLEALPEIIKRFPHVHLYVAGDDITKSENLKDRLKITSYGKYIKKLIKEYGLIEHITFTGNLDEKQMCNRFLRSNVYVSPSNIENSPNSLGEAMLLGVPSVASDVGGVKDMLEHPVEGFVYQHDAPYMLAHYVCEIFQNDKLALEFSTNSRKHAMETHNKDNNLKTMIDIYKEIKNDN